MSDFFGLIALFVPIIAVVGGISVAIVRIVTQARLEELARRERIAAIERGVDPEKLNAIAPVSQEFYALGDSRLRRAHGLMIGGLILVAVGIGLGIMLLVVEPHDKHWVIGLLPLMVGAALLMGSRVVWPRAGGAGPGGSTSGSGTPGERRPEGPGA